MVAFRVLTLSSYLFGGGNRALKSRSGGIPRFDATPNLPKPPPTLPSNLAVVAFRVLTRCIGTVDKEQIGLKSRSGGIPRFDERID